MQKFFSGVIKICHILLAFFMTVLVAITFWQVLCRFVLKIPVSWTEEVVRMSFIWLIFIGSIVAIRDGAHLSLDILTSKFKGRAKHISNILIYLCMLAVCVVMFFGGLEYVIRSIGKTAVTMRIPANCSYVSVPVSTFFMSLFLLEKLIPEFKSLKKGAST